MQCMLTYALSGSSRMLTYAHSGSEDEEAAVVLRESRFRSYYIS